MNETRRCPTQQSLHNATNHRWCARSRNIKPVASSEKLKRLLSVRPDEVLCVCVCPSLCSQLQWLCACRWFESGSPLLYDHTGWNMNTSCGADSYWHTKNCSLSRQSGLWSVLVYAPVSIMRSLFYWALFVFFFFWLVSLLLVRHGQGCLAVHQSQI